ncbi:ferric reduction oxidase 2-like [Euphorbia lathyris]|uniref:ferric reduction oxidase 2-like n=1 Tax=Euphorbia lathyris TaxID=212925 RepID=UPI0033131CDA
MFSGFSESYSRQTMTTVRSAIWGLISVIFLGYMMIWVMMPTDTYYLHWLPDIQAKTSSTFFGEQGANTLIHTFPILFIATLACLYIHIGKKYVSGGSREVNPSFAWWKRPLMTKGPLGIVSCNELSLLGILLVLMVWSLYSYLHSMFSYAAIQAAYSGLQVWEVKLQDTGLSLGLVGNICLALIFFPVARGSSILQLVGLTSEASIKYHIWLGHMALTIFTAHGLCYIIYWAKTQQLSQMLKWDKVLVSNVAGEIALASGLVMWVTSHKNIRRKLFELFFYSHHLYILFGVFYMFHVGISSAFVILPGFYLYLIDRYLRFLQSQQRIHLVSAHILSCETVELNFFKNPELSYAPRSTAFINLPKISKLQWHPFTITSSSNMDPEQLSIVIKCEGNWTKKLYQMLSSPAPADHLEVAIEGPYSPPSTCFLRHDMLVMISGGSGITPFISIIREILFLANTTNGKTPKILLVCAFKKSNGLAMLDLLMPVSGTTFDISRLQLEIEAYITREQELKKENHNLLRTIWFMPKASDVPISAVLGPNSWLWLSAIISASFIIFLLLIGILTRYYIYPIDHNSNRIYTVPSRSALNMFTISFSILITASAAFLWTKKHNSKEMKQIKNTDMPTPGTLPGSKITNTDRELESLPHQSLLQATKVHLGERPNLERILLKCKGESIGVLVSGPKKMRQDAAAICSSSSSDNLHFESISFSW